MKKQRIKITESQLHRIVKDVIKEAKLNEEGLDYFKEALETLDALEEQLAAMPYIDLLSMVRNAKSYVIDGLKEKGLY